MLRAIIEDAAELAGLALFLAALAMIAMPADAMALTPEAPRSAAYWFAGALVFCAVIGGAIVAAVRQIGRDAAVHDDNMRLADLAESITGREGRP